MPRHFLNWWWPKFSFTSCSIYKKSHKNLTICTCGGRDIGRDVLRPRVSQSINQSDNYEMNWINISNKTIIYLPLTFKHIKREFIGGLKVNLKTIWTFCDYTNFLGYRLTSDLYKKTHPYQYDWRMSITAWDETLSAFVSCFYNPF